MDNSKQIRKNQIIFIIICFSMSLLGSTMQLAGSNILQFQTSLLHIDKVFLQDTLISVSLVISLMLLCLFNSFQHLKMQRYFLAGLIVFLLCFPPTMTTFPLLMGVGRTISNLIQAWIQVFVPPQIRTLVSSILPCINGLIDIRIIFVEKYWVRDLFHERVIVILLSTLFIAFLRYSTILEQKRNRISLSSGPSLSISQLLRQYPFIFVTCILFGLNYNIVFYTYFLGKTFLPDHNSQIYQYVVYFGIIILPITTACLADRFGIIKCTTSALLLTILFKSLSIIPLYFKYNLSYGYYVLIFFEAGLAGALWALSSSMIGRLIGGDSIFRSFGLSTLLICVGSWVDSGLYLIFENSVGLTKLMEACINLLLLAPFLYKQWSGKHKKNKIL